MKIVLQSIFGAILAVTGVYVMYLYIISINTHTNVLFLVGSIILLGGAVFLFIKAGKSDKMFISKMPTIKPLEEASSSETSLASRLEKNNAMMGDWKKTNETKDRLRMLEIQASADTNPEG